MRRLLVGVLGVWCARMVSRARWRVRPDDEQNPDETEQNPADDELPDVDLTDIEPAGNDR